jgi:hypothetical protein
LKLLNLLELTFVFRNVLVFCHFFLEKKVTKNSRLCRNPAILPDHPSSSQIMRALGGNPCFEYLKSPF